MPQNKIERREAKKKHYRKWNKRKTAHTHSDCETAIIVLYLIHNFPKFITISFIRDLFRFFSFITFPFFCFFSEFLFPFSIKRFFFLAPCAAVLFVHWTALWTHCVFTFFAQLFSSMLRPFCVCMNKFNGSLFRSLYSPIPFRPFEFFHVRLIRRNLNA